jgi:hypothetical protein
MLNEMYQELCKRIKSEGLTDKDYTSVDDLLFRRKRIFVPEKLSTEVIKPKHDSKLRRLFGRERTMELVSRNFNQTKMERDVHNHCKESNNCKRTTSPKHAKHGQLHPLELVCKRGTDIRTQFITDPSETEGGTIIFVDVHQVTIMAY